MNCFSGPFPSTAIESLPGGQNLGYFGFHSNQFSGELWDLGKTRYLTAIHGDNNPLLGGSISDNVLC